MVLKGGIMMSLALIFSAVAMAAPPPIPFPLFLRQGFSSVLEFEQSPRRVVVGDLQSFQVEKMEKSLVVRAQTAYATSNMFVYFDKGEPRLFVLTASEDSDPTLYRKFEEHKAETKAAAPVSKAKPVRGTRILGAKFDGKKDYLTVDMLLVAEGNGVIRPNWELARLKSGDMAVKPTKTWAERKEVQKNSEARARFIFAKPNVPKNLQEVRLVLPLQGQTTPISLSLGGR